MFARASLTDKLGHLFFFAMVFLALAGAFFFLPLATLREGPDCSSSSSRVCPFLLEISGNLLNES